MYKTRAAMFNHQGRQLIVVPLDCSFESRPIWERDEALRRIQHSATKAGLLNLPVALVWQVGGKLHCLAPDEWHEFLRTLTWSAILAHLNLALECHGEPKPVHIGKDGSQQDD